MFYLLFLFALICPGNTISTIPQFNCSTKTVKYESWQVNAFYERKLVRPAAALNAFFDPTLKNVQAPTSPTAPNHYLTEEEVTVFKLLVEKLLKYDTLSDEDKQRMKLRTKKESDLKYKLRAVNPAVNKPAVNKPAANKPAVNKPAVIIHTVDQLHSAPIKEKAINELLSFARYVVRMIEEEVCDGGIPERLLIEMTNEFESFKESGEDLSYPPFEYMSNAPICHFDKIYWHTSNFRYYVYSSVYYPFYLTQCEAAKEKSSPLKLFKKSLKTLETKSLRNPDPNEDLKPTRYLKCEETMLDPNVAKTIPSLQATKPSDLFLLNCTTAKSGNGNGTNNAIP